MVTHIIYYLNFTYIILTYSIIVHCTILNYIGIGHAQLSELSSAIELPINISSTSYSKHLSMLGDNVKDSALEKMI